MAFNQTHTFHIPVMGIGYTLDTPIKIGKYGVSSAISLVQDDVIEKARCYYAEKYQIPYQPILQKEKESRSRRITSYLDMVNQIVNQEFEQLKNKVTTLYPFW